MPLITVVAEGCAEIDSSRIVFGVVGVKSEEMAVETLAEPVAHFGLYEPVFPPGVAEFPRVVIARYVQRHAAAERRFDAQVDRSRGIVEQVALDSPFLSMGCIYRRQQECQHEINLIHFSSFIVPKATG